jgi:hypothetical protein
MVCELCKDKKYSTCHEERRGFVVEIPMGFRVDGVKNYKKESCKCQCHTHAHKENDQ